jgi:hypothetical protein
MKHPHSLKAIFTLVALIAIGSFVTTWGDHDATLVLEVPEGVAGPSVDLIVHNDPVGGYNLEIITSNFQFTPSYVNSEGEFNNGHAHLFIDGERIGRIYTNWVYVGALEPGVHEIRVSLNADDHREFAVHDLIVEDVEIVTVHGSHEAEEAAGHDEDAGHEEEAEHGHDEGAAHVEQFDFAEIAALGNGVPSVTLEVITDASSGWNLRFWTRFFDFAPQNASTEHVLYQGHAHLYVDGVKVTRIYGDWYHLTGLTAGDHEVRIDLSTNDHRDYAMNGVTVSDSFIIHVTEDQATEGDHGHDDEEEHHDDEEEHHDEEEEHDDDA